MSLCTVYTETRTIGPLSEIKRHIAHVGAGPNRFLFQRRGSTDRGTHVAHTAILSTALKIQIAEGTVSLHSLSDNGEKLRQWLCAKLPRYLAWRQNGAVVSAQWPDSAAPLDEEQRLTHPGVLDVIRKTLYGIACEHPWHCGALFSYDMADYMEDLPKARDRKVLPDVEFLCPELTLEWSADQPEATLVGFAFCQSEHDRIKSTVAEFCPEPVLESLPDEVDSSVSTDCEDLVYARAVSDMKHYLYRGDVFQTVLSRSFFLNCPRPWCAHETLLEQNPARYHFYWHSPEWKLLGASPETSVRVDAARQEVTLYPIAGTRPRGLDAAGALDPNLDERLEAELRTDAKELAEHNMLVDLARNDLARICLPGERRLRQFMNVEKYSRVMHLVSTVSGRMRPELDALHAYQACLNMGTLVGAPKARAMSLLREHEAGYRGFYGGAVGLLDQYGNMDTCIVIRSAMIQNGRARVQAGAGIVIDSDPQSEMLETRMKAMAVLRAIAESNCAAPEKPYAYPSAG